MILNQMIKVMGWPFMIMYILLILGATYFALITIPRALKSNHWPQVEAEVIKTELVKTKRSNKNDTPITVFSAKISYQYTVAGKRYNAQKIKWADHSNTGEKVRLAMLEKYPVNAKINIYYDPNNPNITLFKAGLGLDHYIASLLLLIGIGWMSTLLFSKL
jgi:hypothetical protein